MESCGWEHGPSWALFGGVVLGLMVPSPLSRLGAWLYAVTLGRLIRRHR